MNNSTDIFIKELRKAFPVFQDREQRFYEDIEGSVCEFAEQNPECTKEDLIERFGEPTEIVKTYFDNADSSVYMALLKNARYAKAKFISFVACLALLIVMSLCFWLNVKKETEQGIANQYRETVYQEVGSYEEETP